ncbi:L-serine ammonia-lyase [Acidihalobacter ferrooxydans]|uniref:L-serine dehydratase n=1 Tax=Acidihalobacter ferrooxydans TaxID=1765967 RepID=A0A1P8UKR7_9GAMM|nr:L-serine ammonia-lyase [Acidihalobacter ferrooxydans]APZ44405.1 L-serine ammonia-lyase [Acidihalobacter ferrooxydans]
MSLSVFDLFKIGIGPSSSHTVGPMKAALRFASALERAGLLAATTRLRVQLYGSLGHTGRGHGSDRAVLLGLSGETPEAVDPDTVAQRLAAIAEQKTLHLLGRHPVALHPREDLVFHKRQRLPLHPNGMRFEAFDATGGLLLAREFYSVGGGFVLTADEAGEPRIDADETPLPNPFASATALLERCRVRGCSIAVLMRENERVWRSDRKIDQGLIEIWNVMQACAARGIAARGELPGGLHVPRRAPVLHARLAAQSGAAHDALAVLDWVNLYAIAINEENAAGGRVVTAPTNGAAGVIPAVLHYYTRFVPGADAHGVIDFLLTAGAIGMLYKENASISGADVGCQGEVGVACSMSAGALAAVLGGTPEQIENAAEIGMEHNLGLTCDPVAGLVQIPCIERNAMAAVKAINAARIALRGDGSHRVSLDRVIRTMLDTGRDMKVKYKETSRGGLAVNLIEC